MIGCLAAGVLSVPLAHADMAPVLSVPVDPAVQLRVPPGFDITVFAKLPAGGKAYFTGPRFMAFGPDGNLYLSLGMQNRVVMLPDRNRDGKADQVITVADQLNAPQGIAFDGSTLYVANQDSVVRLEPSEGGWPAKQSIPVVSGLPSGGHTMKTLKRGPDGYWYLNVGSSCNVCVESDPMRATLLRYSRDWKPAGALPSLGRHATSPIWARGLRNTQGWAWHPKTGALFATNNGSDMRASSQGGPVDDTLPPEHLNIIERDHHYGWPHCWGSRVTDPNFPGPEGFCAKTTPPAFTFDAHSTPIGIAFLADVQVPSDYRDDALVALHGSWNRERPVGYKVIRVRFKNGLPESAEDFITGWLNEAGAWGRPVDIVAGPDGAIYISDDRAGLVYRVHYRRATP